MSNQESIRIPKDVIVQVGNDLGMEVNRLASYFGLEEGTSKIRIDKSWMEILPVLLQPLNFSGVKVLFADDSLLFTNVLRDEKDAAFVGSDSEDLVVVPMSPDAVMHQLASYLGEVEQTPRVKQELSLDATIALLAIVDTIRRIKLKNILDPNQTTFDLDLDSVKDEFTQARDAKDVRWLAPFMSDLRWVANEVDFNKSLNELANLGVIQYKNKKIEIDDKAVVLFDELLNRKTMLGIRSVFYHEGALNYLALAFIRTENYIWYLNGTEKSCVMNLNYEELKGLIAMMLAPGEIPPQAIQDPVRKPEKKEEVIKPRFCRNCGEKFNEGAKFCKSCGAKIA